MRLKHYLVENRISYQDFASAVGISRKHLWQILNGADMKLTLALKIEDVTKKKVRCRELNPKLIKKKLVEFTKMKEDKKENNNDKNSARDSI